MKKLIVIIWIIAAGLIAFEPHFMSDPAISPDGEEVCFVYMSDLWVVPFAGGEAKRITASEGSNWNPQYSPDGETIAFNSNRDGWNVIYTLPAEGGVATAISKEDMTIIEWFPNGKQLLVERSDPGRKTNFYKLDIDGSFGLLTGFANGYASLSADGNEIIFSKRGLPYREAYEGSHNGDIWLYSVNEDTYSRQTETDRTERYPKFSKNTDKIFFAYSDGEIFQLCEAKKNNFEERKFLTKFKKWSVRDIDIARENDRIVFEKFDELWVFDPENSKTKKINITIKQDILSNQTIKENVTNKVKDFCVSNDGKLLVFSYKFDLFAMPVEGDKVLQITSDQKGIDEIVVLNDNTTIIYTSFLEGKPQLFRVNISDISNIEKMKWDKYIEDISYENDKLIINYSENEKYYNIAIGDSLGNNIKPIITDKVVFNQITLSKDNQYGLFVETIDEIWNRILYCYDFQNNSQEMILNYNGYIGGVFWGKDGKSAFISKNGEINRIDLKAKEDFSDEEDNWKDILSPEPEDEEEDDDDEKDKKKEVVKTEIDFEDISKRIKPIINKAGYNYVVHVINDSTFYYVNSFDNEDILRKADYLGKNDKKIFKLNKNSGYLSYNEENNCFFYSVDSNLYKLDPESKKQEMIENKFKYQFNRKKLNEDVFDQVWTRFGKGFYDPKMHKVNWKKLKKKYSEYLTYTENPEVLKMIVDEMIGEVNASHTGFYPRRDNSHKMLQPAYLGCELDFKDFPKEGIRIKKVYRKSKLNKPHKIKAGDIIYSIDGKIVRKGIEFNPLLKDKIGEEIILGIMVGDDIKMVTLKGLSYWGNNSLFYDNWIEERKKIVKELSDDRIGYMHIGGMNWTYLQKFRQEIYTENRDKEALIIDVRNNGGGNTHDSLIEMLTKKPYALSSSRTFGAKIEKTPGTNIEVPMVVLINENSFSDAEIFPALFRELKLGKVIGMPTSGSVIGTGHIRFMDESSMRMPSHGWYTLDKENMEGNGVQPDIRIEPTPKQIMNDDDIQLKKAVSELLKEL